MNLFIAFALCCSTALLALSPEEQVAWKKAAVSTSPNIFEIHADGTEILKFDEFSIASHEIIRFVQKQQNHRILINVSSASTSEILGRLQSNCPVYLVNPHGIFIGDSASLDGEAFIVSTSPLPNNEFCGQDFQYSQTTSRGNILNLGFIQANNGDIALIAHSIDNQGKIATHKGSAILIAYPEPCETQSPNEGIRNSGIIQAASIELKTDSPSKQAIFINGILQVPEAASSNGRIRIAAEYGGCRIDGDLIAPAGFIEVDAETVHLSNRAQLEVSSKERSGQIQIRKSCSLAVDPGARLLANATALGDGGSIMLAAKECLIFHGQAQVCGGDLGGNGGTIHLSSHGSTFQFDPSSALVQAFALKGRPGTVIFDPKFIVIAAAGTDPATGNTFGSNPTSTATISPSALESTLNSANLVIQANTDIVFNSDVNSSSNHSLTLQAGRSIQLFSNVALNGGDFLATINDSGAMMAARDPGVACFQLNDTTRVSTQGGNVAITVGTFGGTQEGEIYFTRGTLDAGGGNIAITGVGRQNGSDGAYGITFGARSTLQTTGAGTIVLHGTGGTGANYNGGIFLDQGWLQTESGLLQLTGYGGGNGLGIGCVGIVSYADVENTDNGPIVFQGFSGDGVHRNIGVWFNGGQVQAVDGNITLEGVGEGTGDMNSGIRLESGAQCAISGQGSIALSGTAVNGINNNHGVSISDGTLITDAGGISVIGTSNGSLNYNYGIRLENNSSCMIAGTVGIFLNGQNTGGMTENTGVSISTSSIAIESGYGDIQITGTSGGTESLNQGVCVESGQIISTGVGANAAVIHLTGTGSYGTDFCNGVAIQGAATVLISIDGDIILEGTAHGSGEGNDPLDIDPQSHLECTGSGTIIYISH